MKLKSILASALAVCLLNTPAAFAAGETPSLSYEQDENSAVLSIENITDLPNIYSVQLEFDISGTFPDAKLTANEPDVFTAHRMENTSANANTHLVLYFDSLAPLNIDSHLTLGTLDFGKAFTMPATANLILLDSKSVVIGTKPIAVTVTGSTSPGGDTPGGDDKPGSGSSGGSGGGGSRRPNQGNSGNNQTQNPPSDTQTGSQSVPFTDTPSNSWYYSAVQYVYRHGMMSGTSATSFAPDMATDRAMIVSILHRLEGSPSAPASTFPDVSAGNYYASAVAWASANGIVSGYSNGEFRPNDPITREQFAAILYRYAKYKGYDLTLSGNLEQFSDHADVSSYAVDALRWASGKNLISGTDLNTLLPADGATRAQAASILMRFCQNLAGMD